MKPLAPNCFQARKLVLTISILSLLASAPYSNASSYVLTDLGINSDATSINNVGQIVGSINSRPTLWNNGVIKDLDALFNGTNDFHGYVTGINDAGYIVGAAFYSNDDINGTFLRAVLIHDNVKIDLGLGYASAAFAINNVGQVVGAVADDSGLHTVLWNNGTVTNLGSLDGMVSRPTAINNAGQVVGINYSSNLVSHSTLWSNGTIADLAISSQIGDELNRPEDINDFGQVVGSADTSDDSWNATLWDNGVMTNLGGDHSRAYAINNVGQVVGYNLLPSGEAHATLWENGKMTDLNSLVAASIMGDWVLRSATDINAAGWIVGSMTDSVTLENRGFLLTPLTSVPLPAASWLFGSTVGFLTLMKYRKKSSFFKA